MASSSSSNTPPPAERAAEIVDKLPSHPSLITKTGTAILGSGLLATAISQELYVFNEETVIAVGYLALFVYIGKVRLCFVHEHPYMRTFEGVSADQNVLARRSFASRTKSGPRIISLASRAFSMVRAQSTRRP